jgi:hypothetical protein
LRTKTISIASKHKHGEQTQQSMHGKQKQKIKKQNTSMASKHKPGVLTSHKHGKKT